MPTPTDLHEGLEAILRDYRNARQNSQFGSDHEIWRTFEDIEADLSEAEPVRERPNLRVSWSAGRGNWATIPWIALLDESETDTTTRGVYCVYLFREDGSGVYLTLNQGVTEPKRQLGTAQSHAFLQERGERIRDEVSDLQSAGFALDNSIDLRVEGGLGRDYEVSTIGHKLYKRGEVPDRDQLVEDLEALLSAYDTYLASKSRGALARVLDRYADERIVFEGPRRTERYRISEVEAQRAQIVSFDGADTDWIDFDSYERAVELVRSENGRIPFSEIAPTAASRAALVQGPDLALSSDRETVRLLSGPDDTFGILAELVRNLRVDRGDGAERPYKPGMLLAVLDGIGDGRIERNRIQFDDVLPAFVRQVESVGQAVDEQQAAYAFYNLAGDLFWNLSYKEGALGITGSAPSPAMVRDRISHATLHDKYWELLQDSEWRARLASEIEGRWFPNEMPPVESGVLKEILEDFSSKVSEAGLDFGSLHDVVVRSFVLSLATKPLVILTGLSGSGKTQIALQFGRWFGPDRYAVIPVRPDWTGAEAMFGYPDALLPTSDDGRRAWNVPPALRFMLTAAHDPTSPYLLILDEMNLAHVERYFADVISGMESGEGCLPNLRREDEYWRRVPGEKEKLPFPENLFIAGTVNVDETTYMFSPKVLDRANTLEFRVKSGDLRADLRKPGHCAPGDRRLTSGFLAIARDKEWHLEYGSSDPSVLVDHLKSLHAALGDGFGFGHRVVFEAVRFSALHEIADAGDFEEALDIQVMQKILPRLHGSRRRLEPVLRTVGKFCYDLDPGGGRESGPEAFDPIDHHAEDAKLTTSFDKVSRMLDHLRTNQFVSFTE